MNHKMKWTTYSSNVDDKPGDFYVDLGLSLIDPTGRAPHCFYVSVMIQDPQENGLPSENENEILLAMEKNLIYHLKKKHDVLYAGRMTADGIMDFYFYTDDPSFIDSSVSTSMVHYPHYKYDFDIGLDKNWALYFNLLCPDEKEMQIVMRNQIVDLMKLHGDDGSRRREISHWIYFKTKTKRNRCLAEARARGFEIVNVSDNETNDYDYKFSIWLSTSESVDNKEFERSLLSIWELADKYDGIYDGWETCIELDDDMEIQEWQD